MIHRFGFAAALGALFTVTAVFRFITLSAGFTNDQFLHLAGAQQMLLGDLPTRDFLDAGMPLMYSVSALAQLLLGRTLFAEGVLVAAAFGLTAVFTALAVRELTGSRLLALAAAVLLVVAGTRSYGYPKVLTYAVGIFLLQRYVTNPSTGRLVALAVAITGAFLFRHDHGIYLAAASAVAVLALEAAPARAVRRLVTFAAMGLVMVAPYLAYVQVHGGLWAYARKGLEFRSREFARAGYEWPPIVNGGTVDPQALLLYQYWAYPVVALVCLAAMRGHAGLRIQVARVVPIAIVALLLNIAFTRPPYDARLPDAIAPAVMLGAWLAWMAWHAPPRLGRRAVAAGAALLFALSVARVSETVDQFERGQVLSALADWPRSIRETREKLQAPHEEEMLPSAAQALIPFYDYAGRCTAPDHRVLLVGIIPEVAHYTQRAFAGGQTILVEGYYEGDSYQRAIVERLARQVVPFVLIHGPANETFDGAFPLVAAHVRQRYAPLATVGDDDLPAQVAILIDTTLPASGLDEATGWPCLIRPGTAASLR